MAVTAGMSSSWLKRMRGKKSEDADCEGDTLNHWLGFLLDTVICRSADEPAGYNRRLCSISLAGWPCRVSQALQEYWGNFYPATQG